MTFLHSPCRGLTRDWCWHALLITGAIALLHGCGESADTAAGDDQQPASPSNATLDTRSPDTNERAKKPSGINLLANFDAAPLIELRATGASTDEVLTALATGANFTYQRGERVSKELPVHATLSGSTEELIDWLLFREDYVVSFDQNGAVRDLSWLGHGSARVVSAATPRTTEGLIELSRESVDRYLASNESTNADLQRWLVEHAGSERAQQVKISLHDAPQSLTEQLVRLATPVAQPNSDTQPRHLQNSNNAASNDVAEALARTTAIARKNVQDLASALQRTCVDESCAQPLSTPEDSSQTDSDKHKNKGE